MSSILKALKKLEHEKSGRFPDLLKIDSDILRTVDSSRHFSPFLLALLTLFVFGGGAAVAFFFIKATNEPQTATESKPIITAKILQQPVSTAAAMPKTLPAEIVVVPARRPPVELSLKKPNKSEVVSKVADVIVNESAWTATPVLSKKTEEVAQTVKVEQPAATVRTLRVTGIAYHNSGTDSMAIINGMPVSSGSIIEGATVEEIRKDRVLFQHNGEKFEIQLGQTNQ